MSTLGNPSFVLLPSFELARFFVPGHLPNVSPGYVLPSCLEHLFNESIGLSSTIWRISSDDTDGVFCGFYRPVGRIFQNLSLPACNSASKTLKNVGLSFFASLAIAKSDERFGFGYRSDFKK